MINSSVSDSTAFAEIYMAEGSGTTIQNCMFNHTGTNTVIFFDGMAGNPMITDSSFSALTGRVQSEGDMTFQFQNCHFTAPENFLIFTTLAVWYTNVQFIESTFVELENLQFNNGFGLIQDCFVEHVVLEGSTVNFQDSTVNFLTGAVCTINVDSPLFVNDSLILNNCEIFIKNTFLNMSMLGDFWNISVSGSGVFDCESVCDIEGDNFFQKVNITNQGTIFLNDSVRITLTNNSNLINYGSVLAAEDGHLLGSVMNMGGLLNVSHFEIEISTLKQTEGITSILLYSGNDGLACGSIMGNTIDLAGSLELDVDPNYIPQVGDSCVIMTANTITLNYALSAAEELRAEVTSSQQNDMTIVTVRIGGIPCDQHKTCGQCVTNSSCDWCNDLSINAKCVPKSDVSASMCTVNCTAPLVAVIVVPILVALIAVIIIVIVIRKRRAAAETKNERTSLLTK